MAQKNNDRDKETGKISKKGNEKNDSGEMFPEEILESIPEEERGKFASIIKQTMISGVMHRSNPIAEKITSDHISQLISKSDVQDKRDRDERKGERNYNLILIIIGLLFVGFLIVFLQNNEELLIKVIIGIISFIGGFGFGQVRKNKSTE